MIYLDDQRFRIEAGDYAGRPLTGLEFKIVHYLWEHPEVVRSRDQIMDACWKYEAGNGIYDRSVDGQIKRIRRKLAQHIGMNPIGVYYGVGYFFKETMKSSHPSSVIHYDFERKANGVLL